METLHASNNHGQAGRFRQAWRMIGAGHLSLSGKDINQTGEVSSVELMAKETSAPKGSARQPRRAPVDTSPALGWPLAAGLLKQAGAKPLKTKVQPALFEPAARRVGSTSPAVVFEAPLAALATQDDLGPPRDGVSLQMLIRASRRARFLKQG